MKRRSAAGWSLLESLCVILVMAVISVTSWPRAHDWLTSGVTRRSAKLLANDLVWLSLASRSYENEVRLILNKHHYRAYLLKDRKRILLRRRLAPIVTLISTSKQLSFHPSGVATPRRIRLLSRQRNCSVILSLRSRVRIEC